MEIRPKHLMWIIVAIRERVGWRGKTDWQIFASIRNTIAYGERRRKQIELKKLNSPVCAIETKELNSPVCIHLD